MNTTTSCGGVQTNPQEQVSMTKMILHIKLPLTMLMRLNIAKNH